MTLPDPASVRWHGFGFRGPLNLPLLLQQAGAREAFSILPHPLPYIVRNAP